MADLRGCGRGNECGELDGDVSVRRRENVVTVQQNLFSWRFN